MHTILLYYKYVTIDDPGKLALSQRILCERLSLMGRIIVATEGINGTVEGTTENTNEYIKEMSQDIRFADVHWKKSKGTGTSFPKLVIKVRKEVVSAYLDDNDPKIGDVNPTQTTGKRLTPDDLHQWFRDGREFSIVDMRNDYEHAVGHFEGSVLPPLTNFRDLPKALSTLVPLREKTVLTVCTGGVRCEKASGYLISNGFKDVYQLDGGIVSYMEKYPGQHFNGSLYVFDGRVTVNYTSKSEHKVIGKCVLCDSASELYVNCSNVKCHFHFICCIVCAPIRDTAFCKDCIQKRKTKLVL